MDIRKRGYMTLNEVKDVLIKHFSKKSGVSKTDAERKLIVWYPKNKKNADCYFFALEGTPPKGYGIYVNTTEKKFLCLYDSKGKRFKEYYLSKGVMFD